MVYYFNMGGVPQIKCVYRIHNKISDKNYIGSSIRF